MIVAVSLFSAGGACGGKNGHAPRAAAKIASTCVPTDADAFPTRMALTGATFTFCLAERTGTPYCFTANLEAKTAVLSDTTAAGATYFVSFSLE